MDLGLKGKVAMVAGASRGLGFAVAEALAREGAMVVDRIRQPDVHRRRREAPLRIRRPASMRWPWTCASRPGSRHGLTRRSTRFGGIDLLFTNAGGPPAGCALAFDDAAWQNAIDLLLFSALRMIRGVVPSMKRAAAAPSSSRRRRRSRSRFRIWPVHRRAGGSLRCRRPCRWSSRPTGSASTRSFPDASTRIASGTSTRCQGSGRASPRDRSEGESVGAIPFGRYGEPVEYGRVAAFLLSDAAGYITGATVQVDGGLIRGVL